METRKKLQSGWTLKGKIWTKLDPFLEMGITLKFTETNLFLIKLDYLYSIWLLLWFSYLKLNILLTRLGHS